MIVAKVKCLSGIGRAVLMAGSELCLVAGSELCKWQGDVLVIVSCVSEKGAAIVTEGDVC